MLSNPDVSFRSTLITPHVHVSTHETRNGFVVLVKVEGCGAVVQPDPSKDARYGPVSDTEPEAVLIWIPTATQKIRFGHETPPICPSSGFDELCGTG